MKRFLMIATLAAVGLTQFAATQASAGGGFSHGRSYYGSHNEYRGHHFRASERFGYSRYGFRSFSYTHYRWSDTYRCYFYYAPSYGWCFYEPSYNFYVPITYFNQVYPESVSVITPTVIPTPTVVQQQQTTVVNVQNERGPSVPVAVPAPVPTPVPGPSAVPPPPVAQQKTNVEAVGR
jgi:hypothetical protein